MTSAEGLLSAKPTARDVIVHGDERSIFIVRGDGVVYLEVTFVGEGYLGQSHVRVIASARSRVRVNGSDNGSSQFVSRTSQDDVVVLNVGE